MTTIRHALWRTSLGNLLSAATDKGLCALRLCPEGELPRLLADLAEEYPDAQFVEDFPSLASLFSKVEQVLAGVMPAERVPLDPPGTPFQKRVWQTLVKVPWGKTLSYSELARQVGKPKAVRAVASACARNPIGFVVPCHRILAKGGGLGGYYWGLQMKQELLEREK